jgi:hypothetical protein
MLTLRSEKGSPISNEELDNNFQYIFYSKFQYHNQNYSSVSVVTPLFPCTQININALSQNLSFNNPQGEFMENYRIIIRISSEAFHSLSWDSDYVGAFPEFINNSLIYIGIMLEDNKWNLKAIQGISNDL